jgi:hypothetical protein
MSDRATPFSRSVASLRHFIIVGPSLGSSNGCPCLQFNFIDIVRIRNNIVTDVAKYQKRPCSDIIKDTIQSLFISFDCVRDVVCLIIC